jgi:hypothetical protein
VPGRHRFLSGVICDVSPVGLRWFALARILVLARKLRSVGEDADFGRT